MVIADSMLNPGNRLQPSPSQIARLERALLTDDPALLRGMSASGELSAIFPEWERMIGAENCQHAAHDFPLDEHTFRVVERTRSSRYYRALSQAERRIVMMAALLHDIKKNGGPQAMRGSIPVDRPHPVKSAVYAREVLPALGWGFRETELAAALILHHQAFGTMIMRNPGDSFPDDAVLTEAAVKLRFPVSVPMLRALSEGDIRGVKEHDALFTDEVTDKLHRFSEAVQRRVEEIHADSPYLPAWSADELLSQADCVRELPAGVAGDEALAVFQAVPTMTPLPWLVCETLPQPSGPAVSDEDHFSTQLVGARYRAPATLNGGGFLLETLPGNIAVTASDALRVPLEELDESVFQRVLVGTAEPECHYSRQLHACRLQQAQAWHALATEAGFEGWREAYRFMAEQREDDLADDRRLRLRELLIRRLALTGEAMVYGVQFRPRAVYWAMNGKPDVPVPQALRDAAVSRNLPLIVLNR